MPLTHTHKSLSRKKSQSAMEYLMSYGWAILIIAVVLGVLYQQGVFSSSNLTPKAQPASCQVERLLGQVSLEGECQGQLPQFVGQFNGQNGYITTSVLAGGSAITRFTVVAWVNPNGQQSGCSSVAADTFTGTGGVNYALSFSNPAFCGGSTLSVFGGYFSGVAWCTTTSGITVTSNVWNFVATTYNGLVVLAYANSAAPVVSGVCAGSPAAGGAGLRIGRRWDNPNYINGEISNVQIYNTSLSQAEITALYLEGIGGAPIRLQNLVGWWPLNGDMKDYSGNNYNGQINGGVSFNSTWQSAYTPP